MGITGKPTFDMTTTEPRFLVLSKSSPSYTFHRSYRLSYIDAVHEKVQDLIKKRLNWDPAEIRYYLVPFDPKSHRLSGPPLTFPQPNEFNEGLHPRKKKLVEEIVNDDYLAYNCLEIDFSELREDVQQNIIVVAIGRSAPTLIVCCER